MKKAFSVLLILCVACSLLPAMAEDASLPEAIPEDAVEWEEEITSGYDLAEPADYIPAETNPDATQKDFIGEWKAVYRTVDGRLEYNTDSDECAAATDSGVYFLGGYAGIVINILSLQTFGGTVKASFKNGVYLTGDGLGTSIQTELLQDSMLKVTIVFGGEETVIYYMRTAEE